MANKTNSAAVDGLQVTVKFNIKSQTASESESLPANCAYMYKK